MEITKLDGNLQRMTSLMIAEVTGKNHKDVMRAIRNMEPAWTSVNGRKFALVEYKDKKGETRPCYSLTKTECLYVATKFNDEARAKLVLRWEELEKQNLAAKNGELNRHQLMAQALIFANEEINSMKQLIEEQAPKVAFADAVIASKGCIFIAQLANLLYQNGFETGQKRLFQKLRDLGFLYKVGRENRPKQQYVQKGYFKVQVEVYTDPWGDDHERLVTMVTPLGQKYFIDLFCSN